MVQQHRIRADEPRDEPHVRSDDIAPVSRLGLGQERHMGRSGDGGIAEFWSRGMGWYAMALVDILDDYPVDDPRYVWFQDRLRLVVDGLARAQDPLTGLWYQVVNKGHLPDNWRESSRSGMAVYAIKKAVVRGHVDPGYLAVAEKGWEGLKSRILVDPNGLPVIIGAVLGMGPQNDYARRVSTTPPTRWSRSSWSRLRWSTTDVQGCEGEAS